MTKNLTAENFDATLKENKVVLVDFWAAWCGPCRAFGPIIEEFAKETQGKVLVGKVNVDENQDIAAKYKINSIPTVIVFKNGKPDKTAVGVQSKSALHNLVG